MHIILECERYITEYFDKWLKYFMMRSEWYRDETYSSLSEDCFATTNILGIVKDPMFDEYIAYLKDIVESVGSKKMYYHYLHLVSYDAGGFMTRHKHDHNEDFSFILYLNTCKDGATVLHYDDTEHHVLPERNKVLVFSSDTEHSAKFSDSKRILVGGLKLQ
tara:strand:- start:86 stop:571 length:486 start_codon:yes stop_codon:yes gene_type:complete